MTTLYFTAKHEQTLWIDRRWTGGPADYERDSNSSEKKLLAPISTAALSMATSSSGLKDNNSTSPTSATEENEYAYIDRKSLSTFSGIHTTMVNGNSGIEQQQQQQQISPEPYATTDILRSSTATSVPSNNVVSASSNDTNLNHRNSGSQNQLFAVRHFL